MTLSPEGWIAGWEFVGEVGFIAVGVEREDIRRLCLGVCGGVVVVGWGGF